MGLGLWGIAPSPGVASGLRAAARWAWAARVASWRRPGGEGERPYTSTYIFQSSFRNIYWAGAAVAAGFASWPAGRERLSPRSAGSRASLQGPVCMGKRPDARTTPYKTTPLGIASAPPNVCTPPLGPTEAGGTMWKVKGELSSPEASASFPARQAASPRPVVVRFPGIAPRPRWQPPAAGDGRPPSGARPRPRRPKPGGPLAAGTDGVCGSLAAGQRFRPDSRGEPPCDIRCSPACSRGPVPPPEARMPQPASAREGVLPGSPACGPVSWGAQWGQLDGRARVPGTPGASPRPEQSKSSERTYSTCCPSGGFRARPGLRPRRVRLGTRYLVDSASSHMLVSKIKPCMSKYKQFIQ